MYFVYVLLSKVAVKSYVGITNDLQRRLQEHNLSKHVYTKRYIPWIIIYSEEQSSQESARKRERYLKSAAGRAYLKKKVFEK